MTRHTVINPKTGYRVFKTGVLGKQIMEKKRKQEERKKKKGVNKASPIKKKKDKRTVIKFMYKKAMLSAQDMVDAGFECEKTIAVCAWDKNKKKLLTERADGSPYWSSIKM